MDIYKYERLIFQQGVRHALYFSHSPILPLSLSPSLPLSLSPSLLFSLSPSLPLSISPSLYPSIPAPLLIAYSNQVWTQVGGSFLRRETRQLVRVLLSVVRGESESNPSTLARWRVAARRTVPLQRAQIPRAGTAPLQRAQIPRSWSHFELESRGERGPGRHRTSTNPTNSSPKIRSRLSIHTSQLVRKRTAPGPYCRPLHRVLRYLQGVGDIL